MRRELGMTQQAVADAIGVSNPSISDWEVGKKIPSAANQLRIMEWSGGKIKPDAWQSIAERERAPVVPAKRKRPAFRKSA